ncbi:hypothetical protein HAX54_025836 [Datura stramonium]|uniref:Ubiquitin-like domain-containing protein n=1 Tax=Datura stramonium TaxID=4076 RepID=A0ABS8V2C7_DATST|nr:hypothetical protein [Datura stramonium]
MARREAPVFPGDGRRTTALLLRDGRHTPALVPACNDLASINELKRRLRTQFDMKDLGDSKSLLEIKVMRSQRVLEPSARQLLQLEHSGKLDPRVKDDTQPCLAAAHWRKARHGAARPGRELAHGQARGASVPRRW